ncbi:MAG: GNAT family N-acetyltransferase [Tannerella sp.]|jgi:diamine N-acetyltransferase|nr:GNAT family N-acetyltransferase [Tannerella sp.]
MKLLENETVQLRALEPEDLDLLYRWENDSRLWRYGSTLAPYSRFSLKAYLSDARLDIFQSRQLRLMIVLKAENATVGTVDLYDFDPMNERAGIGILLDERYRHRGLAAEALALIREYAFCFLRLKQVYAYVSECNEPSVKLFTGCGYKAAGKLVAWIKNETDFENVYLMQLIAPSGIR